MRTINLYQARANLSRLVDKAAGGESIVIAKDGKPMAALVPVGSLPKKKLKYGRLKGKIHLPEDTAEGQAEIERLFAEGEIFPRK